MSADDVYRWYLENGEFDDELLSLIQLECFNKRVQPVKVITYQELGDMLNSDPRFNDQRMVWKWFWIFDAEYAVISEPLLRQILQVLVDIDNPWTVVAIVQAITGLNCGFVWHGLRKEELEKPQDERKELEGYGFITDAGLLLFTKDHEEVKDGVLVGFAVFD